MWSKGNTHPLLLGMQTCATTLEISVAVSQETGTQHTSEEQLHSWEYIQEMPNHTTKAFVQLYSYQHYL